MLCLHQPTMFKRSDQNELSPVPRLRTARTRRREPSLVCATCGHTITKESERIEMAGAHQHVCTNPQHVTFRIGCFGRVTGCGNIGPCTAEHTWFKGYQWQIAVCSHCTTHLGWRFTSANDVFYGLILDRLVSCGDP